MDLEQLAVDVFAKLESLAIQGFELGEEMVMKEIGFQLWLYHFMLCLGIVFVSLGLVYFILLGLCKTKEWLGWDTSGDMLDHGCWLTGFICFLVLILVGIIMIPCALVELKHIEINPVYYVLKAML